MSCAGLVRARHRLMARGVVAATGRMIRQAMAGAWGDVSMTIEVRRDLFDRLRKSAVDPREQSCVHALQAALKESDRAFADAARRRHARRGAANRGVR